MAKQKVEVEGKQGDVRTRDWVFSADVRITPTRGLVPRCEAGMYRIAAGIKMVGT